MQPNETRPSRARPRLDYAPTFASVDRPHPGRRCYSGYGIIFIRTGGGYRILRREWLPGEDKGHRNY